MQVDNSRPVAKAYSVILKTVSIRRRDYFFRKKIVTTSGILRAFVLLSACNMDKFKDFEIKSSVSFKKSGGFRVRAEIECKDGWWQLLPILRVHHNTKWVGNGLKLNWGKFLECW